MPKTKQAIDSNAIWEQLFPGQPSAFLKNLRSDERCFFDSYLSSIIQIPGQRQDYRPRPLPKKTYTVFAEGIKKRSEKTPLYSKMQKMGYAPHNSTTMISPKLQPPAFLFHPEEANAGIIFPKQDILPNRYFARDAWTTTRPYDCQTVESANKFYLEYCTEPNLFLFSNEQFFANYFLELDKKYNEVLAYTRFTTNCYVTILTDSQASRWVAIHYAYELGQRLASQNPDIANQAIPILYYLPGDAKHFEFYDLSDQMQDIFAAKQIARDPKTFSQAIGTKNYHFLLVLHDEEGKELLRNIFLSDCGLLIINELIENRYFYHLDVIANRINFDWLSKTSHDNRLKYLHHCMDLGKTNKGFSTLNREDISLENQAENSLNYAVELNQVEVVRVLQSRADVDINRLDQKYGHTCLQAAIYMQHDDIFYALLERQDININLKSKHTGETALHFAVKAESPEMLIALLQMPGIKLNIKSKAGQTARALALQDNLVELVEILDNAKQFTKSFSSLNFDLSQSLERKKLSNLLFQQVKDNVLDKVFQAILNKCDPLLLNTYQNGLGVLHIAMLKKSLSKIELLLNANCDVDLPTPSKTTVLMEMIMIKTESFPDKYQVISLLLQHNADLDTITNKAGDTAIDLVNKSQDEKLKQIFVDHQALLTRSLKAF